MAVNLSPVGNDAPFLDSSGNPLSGGLLYFYTAGSSTPQNTFTTSAGSVANANPVVLDSGGYPATGGSVVGIWLTAGVSYKAVLKTAALVTVWTRDNLVGINDTTVTIDQWVSGPAPTYIGATSFSLVGDQTSTFHVGRRLKTTNSGGTIYSTISASTFGAVTTVTVVNDSGTLDSGLSAVSYGLISFTNTGAPFIGATGAATTFLGADVALNNIANYFNGPTTGAIGASGQVWEISGRATLKDTTGSGALEARIWDGTTVYDNTTSWSAGANATVTIPLSRVVTLSAATTFTLQGRNQTTTSGVLCTTGGAGTANFATYIEAVRLK